MVKFVYYGSERWKSNEFHPEHTPGQTDAEYLRLTHHLVTLTGHEHIMDAKGTLIPRAKREQNYQDAVEYINRHLKLGLEEKDIKMLTLVYTALSEVPRFGGDVHMEPIKGENTGTHSLHTPIQAHRIISRALDKMGRADDRESVLLRQLTGLCLMPHDLGETLGEPGSLAQEVNHAHTGFKKDKPAAERLVLNAMLRLAAHAIEKDDLELFYKRVDQLRDPKLSDKAIASSSDEFLDMICKKLGTPPEISMDGEGRVAILRDFWRMQEEREFVPDRFQGDAQLNGKFVSLLASLCEHVQGTAHFIKFCTKSTDPAGKQFPLSLAQGARMMANFKYTESEVGLLFANAKTDLEKAVATEAKREVYRRVVELIKLGPPVVNRHATNLNERLPSDALRAEEIKLLMRQSVAEGKLQALGGNTMAIRNIETRERLVAIYEWARDHDEFIPKAGQILAMEPPEPFKAKDGGNVSRLAQQGVNTRVTPLSPRPTDGDEAPGAAHG